ncbi:hypothetical protein AVEN_158820-1 [Araneus ventricosus]|uniref:Uncharacterized protein n=1 Tax=Araneus ventricosus TaxID=182803 RepID=A0A4Y2T5Y4_ARAVE|nr:hypothetical protein AVEN_158820-1 [Araneus ventricosus]
MLHRFEAPRFLEARGGCLLTPVRKKPPSSVGEEELLAGRESSPNAKHSGRRFLEEYFDNDVITELNCLVATVKGMEWPSYSPEYTPMAIIIRRMAMIVHYLTVV